MAGVLINMSYGDCAIKTFALTFLLKADYTR
jgi:hypothetical protein